MKKYRLYFPCEFEICGFLFELFSPQADCKKQKEMDGKTLPEVECEQLDLRDVSLYRTCELCQSNFTQHANISIASAYESSAVFVYVWSESVSHPHPPHPCPSPLEAKHVVYS